MATLVCRSWTGTVFESRGSGSAHSVAPRISFTPARGGWPALGHGDLRFGHYRLVPGARLLLRDGRPVELGGRAFDLLHLLLMRRAMVVTKDDILGFVWPNMIVEESNLRIQVAALRKALGDARHLIRTVPGRGYFLAEEHEPA